MRAIQVKAHGDISVLKIAQIPMPSILPSQILVQNHYAGVNFIDTYHRSGLYKLELPFVPGREGSGIVTEVGSQVGDFKIGDRVCYTGMGSYAEFTAVNPDFTIKLPENIDLKVGAGLLIQGLTALAMTRMTHAVKKGEFVLIHVLLY